ncbi:hypothetical protein PMKS-001840 [Pichia membranifaciens]|uniref:Uncharacterized protein n=1 Tax=Pichia membranifaciens TaxID=4926 RepID=A0A1Q2YFQ1_9ASCO|nr:hypothetical protein PMKS-001840 [Pichia membranifaciens]
MLDIDSETLKVDDKGEDNEGGEDLGHVWGVVSVEGVDKSGPGAGSGKEHVDEGQDGTLELGAPTSVDQRWSEALPDNGLADLRGHKQRGTGAKAVTLLKQLVQEDDHQGGKDQLEDQQEADARTEVGRSAVHAGQDVDGGLAEGQEDGKKLLRNLHELSVVLALRVH